MAQTKSSSAVPDCHHCCIRQLGVFCDLPDSYLDTLESSKTVNVYKAHQVIFYEGNHPYVVFCVTSGKVKIYKMEPSGEQQIVRIAGPGDLIGYRCILSGEPYKATAETLEETVICLLDRKNFLQILETHPKTAFNLMQLLANNLRDAEKRITHLVHRNIRERLAELLLLFNAKYGEETLTGIILNISLTRAEIAEIIGTTQESVIRLISEFRQDGLIAVNKRQIVIKDLARLTQIANLAE